MKIDANGETDRFKARLVAKGITKVPRVDFSEGFSPVSRYTTVRLLPALVVLFKWKRILIDVQNEFVNAPLAEKINIEQLSGLTISGKEDMVYKLNKALYGLQQ